MWADDGFMLGSFSRGGSMDGYVDVSKSGSLDRSMDGSGVFRWTAG